MYDGSGLETFQTQNLRKLQGCFGYTTEILDADLSNWDVTNVVTFSELGEENIIFYRSDAFSDCSKARIFESWGLNQRREDLVLEEWRELECSLSEGCIYGNRDDLYRAVSKWIELGVEAEREHPCGHINTWNVSGVRDMSQLFCANPLTSYEDCQWNRENFNSNISSWDVSSVTNFSAMFLGSTFNGDLSMWDISSALTLQDMFKECDLYEGNGIENWSTRNVIFFTGMFSGAHEFRGNMSNFDMRNAMDTSFMLAKTGAWDEQALAMWDVSKVTSMSHMFYAARDAFTGESLESWRTQSVNDLSATFMFSNLNADLSDWNVERVVLSERVFDECWSLSNCSKLNIFNSWGSRVLRDYEDWSNLECSTSSCPIFESGEELKDFVTMYIDMPADTRERDSPCGPIEQWDVSRVENFDTMFCGGSSWSVEGACSSNRQDVRFDLSRWDVSSATSMSGMFYGAEEMDFDVSRWNVQNVRILSSFSFSSTLSLQSSLK